MRRCGLAAWGPEKMVEPGSLSRAAYSYRDDADVPAFADDRPIIVFDGDCALCSGSVQFVLRHDRAEKYRFLPAQSVLGASIYRHYGLSPTVYETNILIKDGMALFKAEGSLRMISGLGFPWSLVNVFRALPRRWRDRGYEAIAANRFRWFGRRATCFVPSPSYAGRFLA
jgi:predicted DCC family thiol-disulfide oxidoreductase YuxK